MIEPKGIPDSSDLLKEARGSLRSSYSVAGSQVLKIIIQFVSVLALTRLFSPEDFGTIALASLAVLVLELIRDQGLTSVLLASPEANEAQINRLGRRQLLIALGGLLVMAISGALLEMQGSYPGAWYVFLLMGLLPIVSAIQMPSTVSLTRAGKFRVQNVADVCSYAVAFGAALALALSGAGLIALVALPLLSALLGLFVRFAFAPWPVIEKRNSEDTTHLQDKGRKVLASNFLNLSAAYTDSITIAIQYSAFQLGGYNRIYQILVGSAGQLVTSLGPLILSALGKLRPDPAAMLKFSDFFIYRLGLPAAILVGAAAPHTKFLLGLAFGEAWVTFGIVFLFLAVAAVFQVLTYMAAWLAMATMSGKEFLRTTGIAKVPAVIALVASSFFGTEAVAGTLAATQVVAWLVFSLSNAKVMKVKALQTSLSGLIVIITLGLVALLSFFFSTL